MSESNHSALGRGIKLYTDAMRRLVKERLTVAFERAWWERGVLDAVEAPQRRNLEREQRRNPGIDVADLLDAQHFEPIVVKNFSIAFKETFPHFQRTRPWLLQVGQARNAWAHPPTGDLDADQVGYGLYAMALLLSTAKRPEAKEIEAIRRQVTDPTPEEPPVEDPDPPCVPPNGGKGPRLTAFFQGLADRLEREGFTGRRKAGPDNWMSFPTGMSGAAYWAWLAAGDEAKVVLVFEDVDRELNKARFDWLSRQRKSIERELGEPLTWDRKDRYKSSHVYVARPNSSIYADEATLREIQDWMIRELLAFRRAFGPRLAI